MQDNYLRCLSNVLLSEGGKTVDVGGPTNQGVTQKTFSAYLWQHQAKIRSVYTMTDAERNEIYKSLYWLPINGDLLPYGKDYTIFDAAVNSGVNRALYWKNEVERRGGTTVGFIDGYANTRLKFMRGLHPSWEKYGRGWARRVAQVRAASRKMANVAISNDPLQSR